MQIYDAGMKVKHPIIGLYGAAGIGKSTLAATAKRPVFIDIEDAIHRISVPKTDVIKSYDDFIEALKMTATDDRFDTVVIDTIDALEDITSRELCANNNWRSLADAGYGKGYAVLKQKFYDIMPLIRRATDYYKKTIIFVGHEIIKKHDDPIVDSYDKIILKLNQHVAAMMFQYSDAFLYMRMDETVVTNKEEKRKIVSDGTRKLYANATPQFMAKNRYGLNDGIVVTPTTMSEIQDIILNV